LATDFTQKGDEKWCRDCAAADFDICKACEKPISTVKWQIEDGGCFHEECFVCDICGKVPDPTAFIPHKGKCYHVDCFQERLAMRCGKCQDLIVGQYYHDEDSKNYHLRCLEM
jgi:hypothetical protein